MKQIEIHQLTNRYQVRRLTLDDAPRIYTFCQNNTSYYQYCGRELTMAVIEQDLTICPPGIPPSQKYYVGFYRENELVAILDLIDGYPDEQTVFFGFFMVNSDHQRKGIGSNLIESVLQALKSLGFQRVRLGIDKMNPPAIGFWEKNGFKIIQEIVREEDVILLAEHRFKTT